MSHPHIHASTPFHSPFLALFLLLALLLPFTHAESDPSASVEYTSDKAFQFAVLDVTNQYRRQHNATEVVWNKTLAEMAEEWSEGCEFKHSGGPTGENLAAGYPNASASIIAWGHEREDYDFKKAEFTTQTGHFTQLVWKSTTSLGCARTYCNNKHKKGAYGWYVVCEYWPHGNVIGQFRENVQEEVDEEGVDPTPAVMETGGATQTGTATRTGAAEPKETGKEEEECMLGAVCSGAVVEWGLVGRGRWWVVWGMVWGVVGLGFRSWV